MLYRVLLGLDLAAAAGIGFFFLWGLADGTVSSFNIGLWLALLGGVGAILWGGTWLARHGRLAAANGVLALLAMPTALYGLFILMVLILQPRWN